MNEELSLEVANHLQTLTLLCVEDNKTIQLIYDSLFSKLVKRIIFAYNGEEGFEKFSQEKVDIIISDHEMPVLSGIDMIKKIRAVDIEIPIVLISAIEDIEIFKEALQLGINIFLKKGTPSSEIIQKVKNVSNNLAIKNYEKKHREKESKLLQEKQRYSHFQEELTFKKELNIIRNDFYYQAINIDQLTLLDFMYKPLDILSGDSYSVRRVSSDITFFLIVDGMGKGLSASLSAMLLTSYINYAIDKMKQNGSFSLQKLIELSIEYIQPILLDEEAIAVDFITTSCLDFNMQYAKFGMPSSYTQNNENKIIKIKSNNPPISKYMKEFKVSDFDVSKTIKYLFYSDGIVENSTRDGEQLYASFIEEDFLNSFTKDEFREKIIWKTDAQEDDMTFIFLNKIDLTSSSSSSRFKTTLDATEEAGDWYNDIWHSITDDSKLIYKASLVFTELFMNAFEHGNLGITPEYKHVLLENDVYLPTLLERQDGCTKEISVTVDTVVYNSSKYVITQIRDEGDGFDTAILSKIFRDSKRFNGRGVFVSRQYSLGIYYNEKGNSVLFLHKVDDVTD